MIISLAINFVCVILMAKGVPTLVYGILSCIYAITLFTAGLSWERTKIKINNLEVKMQDLIKQEESGKHNERNM